MLEWAKAIHEAIGIESPRIFIAVFALIGCVLFAFAGWIIDRGYRAKLHEQNVQAASAQNKPPAAATTPKSELPQPRERAKTKTKSRASQPDSRTNRSIEIEQKATNSPCANVVAIAGKDATVDCSPGTDNKDAGEKH